MQVLPGGVHAVLLLTSPLEVFCTISTAFVYMDSARGLYQTLSKNQYNINIFINFIFPINFSENTTKNSGEYREKNKIVLSKCKSKTY